MKRALIVGARSAIGLWLLAAALWLVDGLFALAFALASGSWLATALDGSLATRSLLKDLDPEYLSDLFLYHGESFRLLLVAGVFLAIGHALLWIWLHAVIVAAVRGGEADGRRDAWSAGLRRAADFSRLYVFALAVLAAFTAAVGGGAWLALRAVVASPSAWIDEAIVSGAGAIWALGVVLLVAVHDHARIRVFAARQAAVPAYRWAWRFVLRGGRRAFWVAAVLQISGALVWLAYQAIGWKFPVGEVLGVTSSLVWGEVFLAARVWVRIWFFAAENELQS